MWIRSQDKESLLKVNCLFIQKCSVFSDTTVYKIIEYNKGAIAEYSTKEKALKVLDKIQSAIIKSEIIYAHEYSGSGVRDYDVFQMPQDSEVE